ncbi:MAG: peptidase E [Rhizobiaceae bacterium]|nr:peptidase E [Rhizobiaceae bacterium]MCV0409137.1 peptidase E [Rhizobiaceae bacterium]
MRLYLSSFDLGTEPSTLASLAPNARTAIIMNALDNRPSARAQWLANQSRKLEGLGFSVVEVDLRRFFDRRAEAREALRDFDMVWINGGNSFLLRRALRQSGIDDVLGERLAENTIVYAGFSAAAVTASVSLRGLKAVDEPHDVPEGYDEAILWEGLAYLPYSLVIHFRSDHPESAKVDQQVQFYEERGLPYRTLRDGEALVVDGHADEARVVGSPHD